MLFCKITQELHVKNVNNHKQRIRKDEATVSLKYHWVTIYSPKFVIERFKSETLNEKFYFITERWMKRATSQRKQYRFSQKTLKTNFNGCYQYRYIRYTGNMNRREQWQSNFCAENKLSSVNTSDMQTC